MNIKVQGLQIEIRKANDDGYAPTRQHNRALTLADFAPSPIAYRLWLLGSSIFAFFEPSFRPLLRRCIVAFLRLIIAYVPPITDALTFDLHSIVVSSAKLPGVQIAVNSIHLHTAVNFTQLEIPPTLDNAEQTSTLPIPRPIFGVAAWRKRFSAGFRRSLDRAWGTTEGTASLTVSMKGLKGEMPLGVQKGVIPRLVICYCI